MQQGNKTDLFIEKRKPSDFGWIIFLSNAENRVKNCQGTAEILCV